MLIGTVISVNLGIWQTIEYVIGALVVRKVRGGDPENKFPRLPFDSVTSKIKVSTAALNRL
jgi:hypothetical protein